MLKKTTIKHYPELTAIHRKNYSFPTRFLYEKGVLNGDILDFGCGHGKDVETLSKLNYQIDKYDAFYHPNFPLKSYDVIFCHYVLNVIDRVEQTKVLAEVSFLLKPGGKAYYTVRRDLVNEGIRWHAIYKKPTYQCNVTLPYESIKKTKHCEIYCYEKPKSTGFILETIFAQVVIYDGNLLFQSLRNNKVKYLKAVEIIKEVLEHRCEINELEI
ncbi:methyltransferase domain-containing protein [Flammeovirga sp. SubArs3]|uniref:methyltransferase domain-containing protein n=1 Tax=Flammeovirga sp. SubArs3 TaxID=2995316 RepID=UPI00248BABA3|nr:methyltransferase domain-containing protein [Flammeovirga sp. SubArs3]